MQFLDKELAEMQTHLWHNQRSTDDQNDSDEKVDLPPLQQSIAQDDVEHAVTKISSQWNDVEQIITNG